MRASESVTTQFNEAELTKLTPQRLKALKTECYKRNAQFYCEACREYHVDMMDAEEKGRYDQLKKNLALISKVQSIKGSLV